MAGDQFTLGRSSLARLGDSVGFTEQNNREGAIASRQNAVPPSPVHWVKFQNTYAGTVIPFGVMRVSGDYTSETDAFLETTRPDATLGNLYAVNGSQSVVDESFGSCRIIDAGRVAYDTSDGTPTTGETWGPGPGSFKLKKNYPGFVILGNATTGEFASVHAVWNGINTIFGIASGSISAVSGTTPSFTLGTGSVAVYVRSSGAIASAGMTITVYNSAGAVADGALVQCKRINGDWFVDVENCD